MRTKQDILNELTRIEQLPPPQPTPQRTPWWPWVVVAACLLLPLLLILFQL